MNLQQLIHYHIQQHSFIDNINMILQRAADASAVHRYLKSFDTTLHGINDMMTSMGQGKLSINLKDDDPKIAQAKYDMLSINNELDRFVCFCEQLSLKELSQDEAIDYPVMLTILACFLYQEKDVKLQLLGKANAMYAALPTANFETFETFFKIDFQSTILAVATQQHNPEEFIKTILKLEHSDILDYLWDYAHPQDHQPCPH